MPKPRRCWTAAQTDKSPDILRNLPPKNGDESAADTASASSSASNAAVTSQPVFSLPASEIIGPPGNTEKENYIEFSLPLLEDRGDGKELARGTVYDPHYRNGMPPKVREAVLGEADEALDALGPLICCSVSRCLNQVSPQRHPFCAAPAKEALAFFLENTLPSNTTQRVRTGLGKLLCFGSPDTLRIPGKNKPPTGMSQALFGGVVGFWRQIALDPDPAEVDDYLSRHNARVPVEDQLTIRRLERMFAPSRFVTLQEKFNQQEGGAGNDYAAFFKTTTHHIPTGFNAVQLSNGEYVHENQTALAVAQTFCNLKLDRVPPGEWALTLGQARKHLTDLYNGGSLNIEAQQQPMAVDLVGAVLDRMQASCSAPGGARASDRLIEAADSVIAEKMPVIQRGNLGHAELTTELTEDPTIADYSLRQADLAKRNINQAAMLKWTAAKDNLWSVTTGWMRSFLEGMEQSVIVSGKAIVQQTEAQKFKLVFDGFSAHFRDLAKAEADCRPAGYMPFTRWHAPSQTYNRYLYLLPTVSWHLMRMACGGGVTEEIAQVWETIRDATGRPYQYPDPELDSIIFDLALSEIRSNGNFVGKEAFCNEIALCRRSYLNGRQTLERFRASVLNLTNAVERTVRMIPIYDEEYQAAEPLEYRKELENNEHIDQVAMAGRVAVPNKSMPLRQLAPQGEIKRSVHPASVDGDSMRSTQISTVRRMRNTQRAIARASVSEGGVETSRMPQQIIFEGEALGKVRTEAYRKIYRNNPDYSSQV